MNSLIKETNVQYDVTKFQQARNLGNDRFKYAKQEKVDAKAF